MGSIDALIRVVDFVLQGVLPLLVIWYAIGSLQWFKKWVKERKVRLKDADSTLALIFSGSSESKSGGALANTVVVLVMVGGAYGLGVVVNAFAFDLLQPQHERIIEQVQSTNSREFPDAFNLKLLLAPFDRAFRRTDPVERIAHTKAVCLEAMWATEKPDAMQGELDPIVKQLRIFRGALICSLAFVFVSVGKTIARLIRPRKAQTLAVRWWPPLVYATVALLLYAVSIRSWADSEASYHMLARFGGQISLASRVPGPTTANICDEIH
jgi:hypothetical protein